jgi:hypothetical protein
LLRSLLGSSASCRLESSRTWRYAALLLAALILPTCRSAVEPDPQPYPANIDITSWPAPGATVDVTAADSVELRFSRSMDPNSLRFVRKMCFLLPLTLENFAGRWNSDHSSVVFDLTQFPVQPGTLYEAVFTGLRTAAGDLYNLGPYRVWFRTRGQPDLLPMRPDVRLSTREFCHVDNPESTACAHTSTWRAEAIGDDSLAVRITCDNCVGAERDRRELYRKSGSRLEWLGFDVYDAAGELSRSVRWPQPPALLDQPVRTGAVQVQSTQTASDGTQLLSWKSTLGNLDSPVHLVSAPGLPIQIVFSESRLVDIDLTLVDPDGVTEHRTERWWLYPGVGLVRRELKSERSDSPGQRYELQSYAPDVPTD